jgi:hypothetical protein
MAGMQNVEAAIRKYDTVLFLAKFIANTGYVVSIDYHIHYNDFGMRKLRLPEQLMIPGLQ